MRRTKEEAEKTRQTVLEAALRLFSRDGYSLTTLSRIAKEAGCSRGPIYWHFENKDDLYEAVLAYSQEPLEALVSECSAMRDTPVEAMDRFIERWLGLLTNDRKYRQSFEILLNENDLTELQVKREYGDHDALSVRVSRKQEVINHVTAPAPGPAGGDDHLNFCVCNPLGYLCANGINVITHQRAVD